MKRLEVYNLFGAPIYHEETVTSTMDISRKLASDGAAHGTVITANFQEAGRGRGLERTWEMEREVNLPLTILLRFSSVEEIPSALTLRVGLAVSLAVEEIAPVLINKINIKWPNDILIDNKKVCGILCEADNGNVHVGIGINVNQKEFPPHLKEKATSIFLETGEEIDRFSLLEKILTQLHSEFENKKNNWKERIEQRLYKKGEEVIFIDGAADSQEEVNGFLTGISTTGELLITPEGETSPKIFVTGEIKKA